MSGMDEILDRFNNLNEQLKEKEMREKAEEIFKFIPMKMERFYERFDKEFMNVPIFKYYDAYQVFQRISCASSEDLMIIKERLVKRAKENPIELEPERENLLKLKSIIEDYTRGKTTSIKTVILQEFARDLDCILNEKSKLEQD